MGVIGDLHCTRGILEFILITCYWLYNYSLLATAVAYMLPSYFCLLSAIVKPENFVVRSAIVYSSLVHAGACLFKLSPTLFSLCSPRSSPWVCKNTSCVIDLPNYTDISIVDLNQRYGPRQSIIMFEKAYSMHWVVFCMCTLYGLVAISMHICGQYIVYVVLIVIRLQITLECIRSTTIVNLAYKIIICTKLSIH